MPERLVGAMNLYASTDQPLEGETVTVAETFAGYAAVAMANAALYTSTAELVKQLHTAMQTRAVIEQAKGILMAKHRYSGERAFRDLGANPHQHSNHKLQDTAQGIVDSTIHDD